MIGIPGRALLGLALAVMCASCAERSAAPARRKVPRVLVVSFDGARPDVVLRAQMPHLRSICRRGSFSFWARTTEIAITLPSHVSMLTGVTPARHGIWWNDAYEPVTYPPVPTLIDLAKQAGYSTALVVQKKKLEALARPGNADWSYLGGGGDLEVGRQAAHIIDQHRPEVMMVHFGGPDGWGHYGGWGSADQLKALNTADRALGMILAALRRHELFDSTYIIISADHGGRGWSHGYGDSLSRRIPWIIAGPGVRRNYDLTLEEGLEINTEDTFATACYLLNLPADDDIDGKPITRIFAPAEGDAGSSEVPSVPWKQAAEDE